MRFAKLLNDIARAEDLLTVWQHAVRGYSDLGFSKQTDAVSLSTLPPLIKQGYLDSGLFARSALFRWAGSNLGQIGWSWLDHNPLTADEITARDEMRLLGMTAGLTMSMPPIQTRMRAMVCLLADDGISQHDVDRMLDQDGAQMEALAHMLHLRACTLPSPFTSRDLTPRQREALQLVASGSNLMQTAAQMMISLPTVEKHLRLAREALSVENTTQAVARAIALNLIFQRAPS